jgi:hypothetical protein
LSNNRVFSDRPSRSRGPIKMAGYAFGSNPPCEFSSRSGNRQDIVSMMEAA